MTRQEAEKHLKQTFGFDGFYDNQWLVIEKILQGKRVLMIEKTGYGKSLCYQFPATQFEGTTVIFTPLIALMRDQVNKLRGWGVSAACINSNQTEEENTQIIEAARLNTIKILYIAPERMENAEWLQTAREMKLAMVVVDEAHCISVWGHDFRPAFRRIINLVNLLPAQFPVLATTATATKQVEKDILTQIGRDITCVRGNLVRNNFHLRVVRVTSEDEKMVWIGENLEKLPGTGIIYTGTRINAEIYANWLKYLNMHAVWYHGRLESDSRKEIEEGLLNNTYKCVVSTNALGMGIDKPDIRFIIHTQMPVSPVHYYQEIGRAGRDGSPTMIILFYNPDEDQRLPRSFIENGKPAAAKYDKVLEVLKQDRLSEREIMRRTNLGQNQIRVIKADLLDQQIINEVQEGRSKKYEYRFNAPVFDGAAYEKLKSAKLGDFEQMLRYIETEECRMNFLCRFLDDTVAALCGKCDNDTGRHIKVSVNEKWLGQLEEFRNGYFPVLETSVKGTALVNGVAASYYGFSNVGSIIHKCKYENGGDYPEFLVKLTVKAFHKQYAAEHFDMIIYTPPTESEDLVKHFAEKLSEALHIPVSHGLKKTKPSKPQKVFQNAVLKRENVKDVFLFEPPDDIAGKSILLIDDIFDSGATVKEIGRYLTSLGAAAIAPVVIAKTVGGDT
jgi:ATP-dependent DNA helicase RecQ